MFHLATTCVLQFPVHAAAGIHPPDAGIHPPDAGIHPPDAGIHLPDAGIHPPDAGIHPPDAGIHPPDAGIHLPDAGIHPADAGSDIRMSPAGGRPFSSSYHPAVYGLSALQWHFICVSVL